MRIPYSADIGLILDFECFVEVSIEGARHQPHLVIDDILDDSGKQSLLRHPDKLMRDLGFRIADIAEDDERLLATAVEQQLEDAA